MQLVDKRRANYVHFFRKLDDPDWIPQLRDRGFFSKPPAPETKGTSVSYGYWPESEFLVRVVEKAPNLVAKVAADIPDTPNILIHENLAQIAAKLPPGSAGDLIKNEARWMDRFQGRLDFGYPEAITDLILVLVEQGDWDNARRLIRSILRTRHDDSSYFGDTIAKVDGWTYGDICEKVFPVAADSIGIDAISEAVRLLHYILKEQGLEPPHDISGSWKTDISIDAREGASDVRTYLADTIRDSALVLIEGDSGRLEEVVDLLMKQEWNIFWRIALFVLADREEQDQVLAKKMALEENILRDPDLWHEYSALIRSVFGSFTVEQQDQWKELVDQGPDWPSADPSERQEQGVDEEEYARYLGHWRRDHLAILGVELPDRWKGSLTELEERWGAAQVPQLREPTSTWVGPTSPLSVDDLDQMSGPEIVDFLESWRPSGQVTAPTPDGLGRMLETRIEKSPETFDPPLDKTLNLGPTYVAAILGGLEKAVKSGKDIDWGLAIGLCSVAVSSLSEESEPAPDESEVDPTWWRWCRRCAASFLSEAFGRDAVPEDKRPEAWSAIKALSWDADPSPEHEEECGGDNMDPLTLSLNTVRGEAMHAMVQYAQSVKYRSAIPAEFSFEDEPDLREELEGHLDPDREPSTTIRGVFGSRLGNLYLMDSNWTISQKEKLFPEDNDRLRLATWNTYLVWGKPFATMLPFLESEYDRAIQELPDLEDNEVRPGREPSLTLAEHIAIHTWHGDIDSDDNESLVAKFLKAAPVPEMTHFIEFIGRSLEQQDNDAVDKVWVERMMRLWQRIEETIESRSNDADVTALAPFGLWYVSGIFPNRWSDDVLLRLFGAGVEIEPKVQVVGTIQQRAETDVASAVALLDGYVRVPGSRLRGMWVTQEIQDVLRRGLSADEPTTRDTATRTVEFLVANGLTQYRDLLDPPEN